MTKRRLRALPRHLVRRVQAWWRGSSRATAASRLAARQFTLAGPVATHQVAIPAADPLATYFLADPVPVRIEELRLDSPLLDRLTAAGVQMAVPLVTQGELVGVFNLGGRRSQQEYSADDRKLLSNLAAQAAPAVRIAQLVKEQQAEFRVRERLEQELRVARLIQQTLLPKDLPSLPGWHLAAYYKPARAVGGDFYDFLAFADGRIGLVIGDVSDKGVPAALVMATTRSILRAAALGEASPGQVLARTNELLCPDIPPKMFVTCLYAILDPASGRLRYANAGHDLPYRRHGDVAGALDARGMPLGLMPGMRYEENECTLEPGDSILLYSDGLVEAHNLAREMFDDPRLRTLVGGYADGDTPNARQTLIDFLLEHLATFVGAEWEQEDDITLVTLHRSMGEGLSTIATATPPAIGYAAPRPTNALPREDVWREVDAFTIPSVPGNERLAMDRVGTTLLSLRVPPGIGERLQAAMAEATMNAMEHGNHYRPDLPVQIQILAGKRKVLVRVTDQGGSHPMREVAAPDLDAKLAGLQSARGWGLFMIQKLVDEVHVTGDDQHHIVELTMYLPLAPDTEQQSLTA